MGTKYSLLYTYMPDIMLSAVFKNLRTFFKRLFSQETDSLMKEINKATIIFYCGEIFT